MASFSASMTMAGVRGVRGRRGWLGSRSRSRSGSRSRDAARPRPRPAVAWWAVAPRRPRPRPRCRPPAMRCVERPGRHACVRSEEGGLEVRGLRRGSGGRAWPGEGPAGEGRGGAWAAAGCAPGVAAAASGEPPLPPSTILRFWRRCDELRGGLAVVMAVAGSSARRTGQRCLRGGRAEATPALRPDAYKSNRGGGGRDAARGRKSFRAYLPNTNRWGPTYLKPYNRWGPTYLKH